MPQTTVPHPTMPSVSRQSDFGIHELFLKRWSSRAMTGEPLPVGTLQQLFEAARWAPSSSNEQEWRFLYAEKGSDDWQGFFNLLMDGNKVWCERAAALVVVLSKKTLSRNGNPNLVHSLDTGMAVQNLLLQAAHLPDLVAHPMGGFDRTRAKLLLQVPDDVNVECMIAVGVAGRVDLLSPELQAREAFSTRKTVAEIAKPGKYSF